MGANRDREAWDESEGNEPQGAVVWVGGAGRDSGEPVALVGGKEYAGRYWQSGAQAKNRDVVNPLKPPTKGGIPAAFVMSEGTVLIDFAGPWEVFENVMLPSAGMSMDDQMPFHPYIVAEKLDTVEISGGMKIVPEYTFKNAPKIVKTGHETYEVDGDFTSRGVSNPEKLTLTVPGKGTASGEIKGKMVFNRKDYGMKKCIPFIKIADHVDVNFHLKGKRVSGPPMDLS